MRSIKNITSLVFPIFLLAVLVLFSGCNAANFKNQVKSGGQNQVNIETVTNDDESTSVSDDKAEELLEIPALYAKEQKILEDLYDNFDEAIVAHMNGNLGLAEMEIENALLLFQQIDLDEIEDESVVLQFKDAAIMVAMELGKILNESAIIAEEDPLAWLEDVDAEQFKSGQWTDEELEKIVLKIAVTADVPIEYNKQVRNLIYYFQNRGRNDMAKWLKRGGRYIPMMREIGS